MRMVSELFWNEPVFEIEFLILQQVEEVEAGIRPTEGADLVL